MSSISQRFVQAGAVLWVLGAGVLGGCSVSTGGAAPVGSASYMVCAGSHASRLETREEVGRLCQRSAALLAIY